MTNLDTKRVTEYAQKSIEKRKLTKRVAELSYELELMERELLEQYAQAGVRNVKLDGLGTVYISSLVLANAPLGANGERDYDTTCNALIEYGAGALVQRRFNASSLRAFVSEFPRNEIGEVVLPDELKERIEVVEKFKLVTRSSST